MDLNQHRSPKQHSDQMTCSHCNKTWDMNDPYPPACSKPMPPDWWVKFLARSKQFLKIK